MKSVEIRDFIRKLKKIHALSNFNVISLGASFEERQYF